MQVLQGIRRLGAAICLHVYAALSRVPWLVGRFASTRNLTVSSIVHIFFTNLCATTLAFC